MLHVLAQRLPLVLSVHEPPTQHVEQLVKVDTLLLALLLPVPVVPIVVCNNQERREADLKWRRTRNFPKTHHFPRPHCSTKPAPPVVGRRRTVRRTLRVQLNMQMSAKHLINSPKTAAQSRRICERNNENSRHSAVPLLLRTSAGAISLADFNIAEHYSVPRTTVEAKG